VSGRSSRPSRLGPIGIIATVLVFSAACAAGKPASIGPPGPDGGPDNVPVHCLGNTTCQGNVRDAVFACQRNGSPGALLETCGTGTVCSLGRCVSESCADVEAHASITGCLFYVATLDNVTSDDGKPTLIVVTNPGQDVAMVQLQERTAPGAWSNPTVVPVAPGSATGFSVVKPQVDTSPQAGPPPDPPAARRVVSDAPVTVMMVESDDADSMATSSSGTMVLPAHALGTNYMTLSYQQVDTVKVDAIPGSQGGAAEIAVVATQDNTSLWIYAPLQPTGAMPMPVTLAHDGDVYKLASSCNLDTQAGTVIASDQRVAVFSGNVTTTYGQIVDGINSPDMAMEQMLPTGSWSRSYLAARLPAQEGTCDSIFPAGVMSFWQIMAADDANVSFTSASGQPLPGLPTDPVTHMSKGVSYPYWVASADDFIVQADRPILVTQGIDCEPTLASAVPLDAASDVQWFTLAPNFDHMLAIVRKNNGYGRVVLDGDDITDQFKPVAFGFEVARVSVPHCYGPVPQCVHQLTGAYGMTLRGMDVSSSYSTTFPSWVQCFSDSCTPF
jgi:hypothetical protein